MKNIRIERRNRPAASVMYSAELPPLAGQKNSELDTFEPSAVIGVLPSLFVRRHFIVQAERRPMVAIRLSDVQFRRSHLGFLSAEIEPPGGEKTMMPKNLGRIDLSAALAVSPRFFVRRG